MSYKKAEEILPKEVIKLIQEYIDGESIYIPRKENTRKAWGSGTESRAEILKRNENIYREYLQGEKVTSLACQYYLSKKSIQRIILQMKNIA